VKSGGGVKSDADTLYSCPEAKPQQTHWEKVEENLEKLRKGKT
jgi:hypothetical protein